jgi:hypothetical protein
MNEAVVNEGKYPQSVRKATADTQSTLRQAPESVNVDETTDIPGKAGKTSDSANQDEALLSTHNGDVQVENVLAANESAPNFENLLSSELWTIILENLVRNPSIAPE